MPSFNRYIARTRSALFALVALTAIAMLAVASPSALAQAPAASSASPSERLREERGPADKQEVEAFMDGFFAQQIQGYRIPGATVSVVKDGEVLFAKGYGQADVEADEPVVADETLFRIASTSKLLTATAAMQLVEEGEVDLDEDVNTYLDDVEIPDTYPGRPVTMHHLLTHTAGFEDLSAGMGARNAADVEPLGEYLSARTPERVRPPGEAMAYSNYGLSLAGHVVEEVSGVPFERYVEENVFGPLDMGSTTFAQPPAGALGERLATGYDPPQGAESVAGPFEYVNDVPSGAASTTSADMARFMTAHLQNGRYGDARILEEATAEEMHARQSTDNPRLDGMAYGFIEQTQNGERTIQHGGNIDRFHSLVALLPERDVGIFVAYNGYGDGGRQAEYELLRAFLDHYYPADPPPAPEPFADGNSGNAERVAGTYLNTRTNQSTFEKVFTIAPGPSVSANGDGSITTAGVITQEDLTGAEQRWVEVEPLLFEVEGSDEQLAFRENGEGRITYMTGEFNAPNLVYEKLSPYKSPTLHLGLLAGSLAVFGLTAVAWPAGALISRRYARRELRLYWNPAGGPKVGKPGREAGAARLARPLAWAVGALALVFAVGMVLVMSDPVANLWFGYSPLLVAVLVVPFVIAVLTVGVLVYAALAWRRGYWGLLGRVHYSLVALSALTLVALLGYYNLIGFRF